MLRLYRNWVLSTSRLARTPEESIADNKSKPGGQDRTRININEDYELRDWSRTSAFRPKSEESSDFRAIDACLLGPLENRNWMIAFGVVFVISIVAFRPFSTLDMIEPSRVAWFALFFFVLALMSLWVNWFRFMNIWVRLRSILDQLENLPIRTAFERLPRATAMEFIAKHLPASSGPGPAARAGQGRSQQPQ